MTAVPSQRTKRPWWQWAVGAVVALVLLNALFGGGKDERAATTATDAEAAPPPRNDMTADPVRTIADAKAAADNDDFAEAVSIAAALGPDEETAIRRGIGNRIARRASAAVEAGDQGEAKRLLLQADGYPTTTLTRDARASYRAAKARARQARARRLAAEQQRQAEAERKAVDEQAPVGGGGECDPNYEGACLDPNSADYDCQGGSGDGPDYTGTVTVVGSDPFDLDRDGDGTGCD